jgi:alkylhydroperoxidase/carboxymuconolactone decarboxylase family protein YurZ
MTNETKSSMSDDEIKNQLGKGLMAFSEEFGKVLDPVTFLKEKNPELCAAFLKLHELTLNDGAVSKKHKFLIHAAITASQHDRETTAMHIIGAMKAGASEEELLETAFTLIPVAGMPVFAVFLAAWRQAKGMK